MARISAPHATEVRQRKHVLPVILDIQRITSEQQQRIDLVDIARRLRHIIGFAQPDEPVVSIDAHPQIVGQRLLVGYIRRHSALGINSKKIVSIFEIFMERAYQV